MNIELPTSTRVMDRITVGYDARGNGVGRLGRQQRDRQADGVSAPEDRARHQYRPGARASARCPGGDSAGPNGVVRFCSDADRSCE